MKAKEGQAEGDGEGHLKQRIKDNWSQRVTCSNQQAAGILGHGGRAVG